jgi:hypothetical protein
MAVSNCGPTPCNIGWQFTATRSYEARHLRVTWTDPQAILMIIHERTPRGIGHLGDFGGSHLADFREPRVHWHALAAANPYLQYGKHQTGTGRLVQGGIVGYNQ